MAGKSGVRFVAKAGRGMYRGCCVLLVLCVAACRSQEAPPQQDALDPIVLDRGLLQLPADTAPARSAWLAAPGL